MSEVIRYNFDGEKNAHWISETDEGHFVKYEDYAALQKQNEINEALLYAMRQDMRESREKMEAMLGENVALKGRKPIGYIKARDMATLTEGNVANLMPNDVFGESPVYLHVETPATDAIANELRAEGIRYLASESGEMAQKFKQGSSDWRRWKSIVFFAETVATQLRAGNVEGGE